ncbi:hypothetical protein BP6252_11905 [Coleophoma cylindrospora]|uniref:Major facilitator superfamily (MFS) profile domain-containing protein n=1 Tax=Coleophoma cylindrospora TaxID=1849047 RepID=A0A3D8QKZ5_9HELO|nr:hypothetical protein BP6252_11905 [Coleophoma cylindrospora]
MSDSKVVEDDKMDISHLEETKDVEKQTTHIAVSDDMQKRIKRKFDRRVLPIVCILYVLSYLDRGNTGNAKTAGAQKDLNLSDSEWTWVLNAFYICYTLCEWSVVFWKIFPAHIYVAALCVVWGAAAMASGAVHNMASMIVVRVILGILEAGFGAGAPYYLSLFYQRRELGFRVSLLLGMSPLASCFAAALAYGITHIKGSIQPWRLLFIIEGAPTVLAAPFVFFLLPDSPDTARFLTEEEQKASLTRLTTVDTTATRKLNWHQVLSGMGDYKNYTHALIHFCCNYSFAGLSNFLPTIVQNLGYSSIQAQGLTAPPYLLSFILCVCAAIYSDRFGHRGFVVAGFSFIGGVGYLLLATIEKPHLSSVRYFGIWLSVCGIFPALAINLTWLLNNQGGDSKRGTGLAILAILGQCSSFASSALFPTKDA